MSNVTSLAQEQGVRTPALSVCIVTYNSENVLADCLESLASAVGRVEPFELIIVDNGSEDSTTRRARTLAPWAQIVELGANRGYAAGINAATRIATGEAVLLINPDVRLGRGCVPRLVAGLAEPGVGIRPPRLPDAAERLQYSLRREPTVLRAVGEAVLGGRLAGRFGPLGEVVTE